MDQKRFILAVVLSAGVLFVYQMYFVPKPSKSASKKGASQRQQKTKGAAESSEETAAGEKKGTKPAPEANREAGGDAGTSAAAKAGDRPDAGVSPDASTKTAGDSNDESQPSGSKAESQRGEGTPSRRDIEAQSHVLKMKDLRVAVTNTGTGRATSIEILKPKQYAQRGDLLDAFPKKATRYPFEIDLTEDAVPFPEEPTFEFVEDASEKADDGKRWKRVVYRYTDPKGQFHIDKVFSVGDDPYAIDMKVVVVNEEARQLSDTLAVDVFGYKDPDKETSFLNFRPNAVEGVCRMGSEAKRSAINDIEEALEYDGSEVYWGAIDTRYFMMAAIPNEDAESCSIEKVDPGYLRTRLQYDDLSVRKGKDQVFEHTLYLGPKDTDIMGEVGCGPDAKGCEDPHHLTDSINYGLFAFIARPLRWGLDVLQKHVVSNWGLAIILLTIIIKLLTWPINMKAYRSMEGMKEIQPKLEEIRDKYEDDRQRMTEETMKLFRENDVSPMGGCLPMILQMPILYGLYVMIYSSVELYHADFILWYTNLAAPDPLYVLPILMGVVMFIQQGMMSSAGGNMQAKVMTKVMPVMFTAFMLFLPSGLVLYYSVNLMIGLGQQFYIRGFDFGDSEDDADSS